MAVECAATTFRTELLAWFAAINAAILADAENFAGQPLSAPLVPFIRALQGFVHMKPLVAAKDQLALCFPDRIRECVLELLIASADVLAAIANMSPPGTAVENYSRVLTELRAERELFLQRLRTARHLLAICNRGLALLAEPSNPSLESIINANALLLDSTRLIPLDLNESTLDDVSKLWTCGAAVRRASPLGPQGC